MKCEKWKLVYWVVSKGMFPDGCLDFGCALPSCSILRRVMYHGRDNQAFLCTLLMPLNLIWAHYLEFLDGFGWESFQELPRKSGILKLDLLSLGSKQYPICKSFVWCKFTRGGYFRSYLQIIFSSEKNEELPLEEHSMFWGCLVAEGGRNIQEMCLWSCQQTFSSSECFDKNWD